MSTRDEYASQIKSAFLSLGKQAAMRFLITKFPFLGLSIINPIVGFFVEMVLTALITETEMAAFFLYIDMRTGSQSKAFEQATKENQLAQIHGTPNEKKLAEEKLRRVFREFAALSN